MKMKYERKKTSYKTAKEIRRAKARFGMAKIVIFSIIPEDKYVTYNYLMAETGYCINTIKKYCNYYLSEGLIWKQLVNKSLIGVNKYKYNIKRVEVKRK